jgi:hypothetical protein
VGVTAWPDLGGDHQVVGVGRESIVDQLVRRPESGEIEGRCVDVVDAQLDRAPEHGDGLVAVAREAFRVERPAAGQPHRAESESADREVAEGPGSRVRS